METLTAHDDGGSGRPRRVGPFLPWLIGLAACGGRVPDALSASPPAVPSAGPLEGAPVKVELTLRLADERTALICPDESYVWPGCEPHSPGGYANFYDVGEPLVWSFGPAGVYDLAIETVGEEGTPARSARRQAVPIGEAATTLDVELGPDLNLRFTLQADPPGRPDGDICALGGGYSDAGSSRDPRATCRVEAPDGRVFERTAFTREFLYWSLMTMSCRAGVHMLESDYAHRFRCDAQAADAAPGTSR